MNSNEDWTNTSRDRKDPEPDGDEATHNAFSDIGRDTSRPTELAAIDRLKQEIEETERKYGSALSDMRAQLQSLQDCSQTESQPSKTTPTRVMDDLRARMAALAERIESADTQTDSLLHPDPSHNDEYCSQLDSPLDGGGVQVEPVKSWSASPESTTHDETEEVGKQDEPKVEPLFDMSSLSATADSQFDMPEPPVEDMPAFAIKAELEPADDDVSAFTIETNTDLSEEDAPAGAIETPSEPCEAIQSEPGVFAPERNPGRRKSDQQLAQYALDLSDAGTANLEPIEQQLKQLSTRFGHVEAAVGRIEAVEANVDRLSTLFERNQATVATAVDAAVERGLSARQEVASDATLTRLETLEQEIRALGYQAKESDARTVDTLEAIHDALRQIVTRLETVEAPGMTETREPAAAEARAPAGASRFDAPGSQGFGPDSCYEEVRICRSSEAKDEPELEEQYRPEAQGRSAEHIDDAGHDERRDRADRWDEDERARSGQDELITEARRAARAAARTDSDEPRRAPRIASAKMITPDEENTNSGRKRPILVGAAIVLLVVSAGLLYTKIRMKQATNVMGATEAVRPLPKPAADPRSQRGDVAPMAPTKPAEQGAVRPTTQRSFTAAKTARLGRSLPATGEIVEKVIGDPKSAETKMVAAPAQPASFIPETQEKEFMLGPGMMVDTRLLARKQSKTRQVRRPTEAVATPAAPKIKQAKVKPSGDRPAAKRMPPMEIGPASLRHAAAKGSAAAQYEVGLRFAKGKGVKRDYAEAVRWLRRAAGQGLAPAQYRIATLYERGRGVQRDLAQARVWYERGAMQGNIKAMHNLAVLHTGRLGDAPDYDTASKWFLSAALYGLADSQFNLGVLYEHGLGLKRNLVQAYKWFTLAADQGDNEAVKRKALVRGQLSSAEVKAVERAVRQFKPKQSPRAANVVTWSSKGWQEAAASARTVEKAQVLLAKLGYETGPADGKIGPKTKAAITAFEKRAGLPTTGRVTERFLTELASAVR